MHHAECIVGDPDVAYSEIPEADRVHSADMRRYTFTQLGIDDARALKHETSQRGVEGAGRVFIITFRSATLEAQNALLKLFEEPALGVRFYILIPKEDVLIPTVRSRLSIRHVGAVANNDLKEAQEFLALPYAERLLCIAERTKNKDDAWCDMLVRGLEEVVRNNPTQGAHVLLFTEKHLRGPGASRKMLLEHLALALTRKQEA